MRAFIAVGGVLFAAMFVAHVWRLCVEGLWLLREPIFDLTSVTALGAAIWAVVLFFRGPSRADPPPTA